MLPNRALAPTTFWSGPDEELATADVYEIQSDAVINNLPLPKIETNSLAGELRGGASMKLNLPMLSDIKTTNPLKSLSGAFSGDGKGFLETAKTLGKTVYNALGGMNGIKDLAKGNYSSLMQRAATGGLNGIPGLANTGGLSSLSGMLNGNVPPVMNTMLNAPIAPQLGAFATVGGMTSKLPAGNIQSAFQMGGLISNLVPGAPANNIVDKDMTSRLITAIAVGGMSSGVNGAFSAALPLAGGDNAIIANAARAGLYFAANSGNIHGFKDVVDAVGPSNLIGMGKMATKALASNFTMPWESSSKPSELAKESFTSLTGAFDKLDPKWSKEDVQVFDPKLNQTIGYPVIDISVAQEGNREFQSVMRQGAAMSTNPDLQCFALAGAFATRTPEEELEANFPMTFTSIATKTTPQIVEVIQKPRNPLDDITIDGKYGDWRDDVQLDGVSNNSQSSTVVKIIGG